MREASDAERRASRAEALLAGTLGSGGERAVGSEELRARLCGVAGFEPTEAEVARLGAAVGGPATAFGYEDLAGEAFDVELAGILAERRQREAQRRVQEREAQAVAQAAQRAQQAWAEPVLGNDDRSIGTRVLASLAYVLPLIDLIQYGPPLAQFLPILSPLLALLAIPSAVVSAAPLGFA
ncbi:unnamed protein product [Prorocentrum cordatum]|uniref:Uncharacterized protein n=1 Tax=Prorocentrum cordatum TaxID=2364126 RepID=A0ABN9U1G7_9DINO|nr:unnamed protein product [Polarella glacialis]